MLSIVDAWKAYDRACTDLSETLNSGGLEDVRKACDLVDSTGKTYEEVSKTTIN